MQGRFLNHDPLFYWCFSDIPLLVRVKTPILRDTLINAPIKRGCFSKIKVLYSGTKEVSKYGSIE
jgi:hypothetical protein